MATYKIGLSADQKTVHVALNASILPAGYTSLGTFDHDDGDNDADDALGIFDNHVLFHHVRDILYKTPAANPDSEDPATYPDGIYDMGRIAIIKGWENAPINVTLPAITGTAQVGQVLTSSTGTWTGTPTSYTRRWFADDVVIVGATAATYTPQVGDIGKAITVEVTGVNANGSGTPVVSAATTDVIAA